MVGENPGLPPISFLLFMVVVVDILMVDICCSAGYDDIDFCFSISSLPLSLSITRLLNVCFHWSILKFMSKAHCCLFLSFSFECLHTHRDVEILEEVQSWRRSKLQMSHCLRCIYETSYLLILFHISTEYKEAFCC